MMNVYVVFAGERHEGGHIVGVYPTMNAAIAAATTYMGERPTQWVASPTNPHQWWEKDYRVDYCEIQQHSMKMSEYHPDDL